MTEPVIRQIARLWPRLGSRYTVSEQIPAARGIIDLVAAELDLRAVARRRRREIGPILRPELIQILWVVRDGKPHRLSTLARIGGWSPSVIGKLIPTLESMRLVRVEKGHIEGTGRWEPLGRRLLAIELKRTAWRRALRQASYFTFAADRTLVVMDARSRGAIQNQLDEFTKQRVGLAVVSSSGDLRIIRRAPRNRPIGWLHALLAEFVWARSAQLSNGL